MIQSLYIVNSQGEVIIQKHWRKTSKAQKVVNTFWTEKMKRNEPLPPVMFLSKKSVIHELFGDIYFIAVVDTETSPLLVLDLLKRLHELFENYFGTTVTENSLKDNFILAFEILSDSIDNGLPVTTERSILDQLFELKQIEEGAGTMRGPGIQPGTALSSGFTWRRSGIKHRKNRFLVDFVETINAAIDRDGKTSSTEVTGFVQCLSELSDMPKLQLVLENTNLASDFGFHQCVDLDVWKSQRRLQFIPPDGNFEIMTYASRDRTRIQLPIYANTRFRPWGGNKGARRANKPGKERQAKIEINVGIRAIPKGRKVIKTTIIVKIPVATERPMVKTTAGEVLFNSSTQTLKWEIGVMPDSSVPNLKAKLFLAPGASPTKEKPIARIDFEVEGMNASGLKATRLEVMGINYKVYKGVKESLKSGEISLGF